MGVTPVPCDQTPADVESVNGRTGDVVLSGADAPPDFDGGTLLATDLLDGWLAQARGVGPTDVVVIGDSFTVYQGTNSFPWSLDRRLVAVSGSDQEFQTTIAGWRHAASASVTPPKFGTWGGAVNGNLTGAKGGTLTVGQKGNTGSIPCDAVSIVYRTAPGAGDLIVRDGVGGTVLTTIDTDAAAGVHLWTSASLGALAAHTIEVEASGGTVNIDGAYLHNDNRATGIRVWNAGNSGATTAQFVSTPGWGLDLVQMFATLGTLGAVVIATGTNDAGGGADDLEALVDLIRAIDPDVTILSWIPYVGATQTAAAMAARRDRSIELGLVTLDGPTLFPDAQSNWTEPDGIHPLAITERIIASHMALVLSGDPIGNLLRTAHEFFLSTLGGTVNGNVAVTGTLGVTGASTLTGGFTSGGISLMQSALALGADALTGVVLDDVSGSIASYLSGVSWLGGDHGSGLFWGGRRSQINAQTGTGYTVLLADQARTIVRANAGASTMTWPIDSAQAIPIGTQIPILNNGAGTITHSCPGGTISGTLTQAQNVRRVATKTAANTWFVA